MGKQDPDSGKVKDEKNGKFKIEKGNGHNEVDIELQLPSGTYEVKKLKVAVGGEKGLPEKIDNYTIRWFNNFSIKEGGNYIKKKYTVTITNLKEKLGSGKLVIYSETHDPKLYYLDPQPEGDSFDLEDGDPAGRWCCAIVRFDLRFAPGPELRGARVYFQCNAGAPDHH